MKYKHKKIIYILASVVIVIMALTFITNYFIEQKLNKAINDLPKQVEVKSGDINANIWSGSIEIISPSVSVYGETTNKTILSAHLKAVKLLDLSYWDFLFNDEISVESLIINQLVVEYKHNPLVKNNTYKNGLLNKINQIINIEKIAIKNADVLVTNYQTDATLVSIPKLNFELNELQINSNASNFDKKINYQNFILNAENLKWAINEYDDVFVETVKFSNDVAVFNQFKLKTKYNKSEYSQILKTERDHFNLNVKEIKLLDMNVDFSNSEKFYFTSESVKINLPEAEIYRDKLVADDLSYKSLYGTSLRELGFKLGLKTVHINNGKISYSEKVKAEEQAGNLYFTNLNATILNLGNTFGVNETLINVKTDFMDDSPLTVNWDFKVADTTDQFVFKADLGSLDAAKMDQFTKPNLNVDFNGELKQTYFTISGNPLNSQLDLKIKYSDFEVLVLKKNGKAKNKFLSGLVNLLVAKDSNDEKQKFRYGQANEVERDVTKSVFNFVWLNIKEGLLSAMTGDGEKED